jgi:serine phosphatase RsbU (regulator of sigma subunit)/anti-sigma regulatory factor (Ser/Thr protein kinase)
VPNILIVDDLPDNLGALKAHLELREQNWHVLTARSLGEVKAILGAHRLDVIITDFALTQPFSIEESGIEVLRQAKQLDPLVMVIVLTAYEHKMDRYEAFDLGAFDCIAKNTPGMTASNEILVKTRAALRFRELALEHLENEKREREWEIARSIQQRLLPKELPQLSGWHLDARYLPARIVGGDFYDVRRLSDGRLGLSVGDATGKGMPAALMMASTCTLLRAMAEGTHTPGEVLAWINEVLCPEVPPGTFVTCFYAILDPSTGNLRYANAGHCLPYHWRAREREVIHIAANGTPLGITAGERYDEHETTLAAGDIIFFYSDGLVEAHDPQRQMFGMPRLQSLLSEAAGDGDRGMIDMSLNELAQFTGPNWEQEDDVTLMTLRCSSDDPPVIPMREGESLLAEFSIPSIPDNERLVLKEIDRAVRDLHLSARRIDQLKTAIAEATMNAMEHGNGYRANVPVHIEVAVTSAELTVRITDQGHGGPLGIPAAPDLTAKLANREPPRGWGLFLIEKMVDDVRYIEGADYHTIELIMTIDGTAEPRRVTDAR